MGSRSRCPLPATKARSKRTRSSKPTAVHERGSSVGSALQPSADPGAAARKNSDDEIAPPTEEEEGEEVGPTSFPSFCVGGGAPPLTRCLAPCPRFSTPKRRAAPDSDVLSRRYKTSLRGLGSPGDALVRRSKLRPHAAPNSGRNVTSRSRVPAHSTATGFHQP